MTVTIDRRTIQECEVEIEKKFGTEPGDDLTCWITTRGHIIPVDFHGHASKIYELMDAGLLSDMTYESDIEKVWMKVSRTNWIGDNAVYHEGKTTAKQKIALTKIMEKFPKEFFNHEQNGYFQTFCKNPYMVAILENGKVRFEKD